MTTKLRTTIAALAATFAVSVAAGPAHAQPNTGDPIYDGYCAALQDEAKEYATRYVKATSDMTQRYWQNRLDAVLAKARKERCEWVAAPSTRPVMTPGKLPGGGIVVTAGTSD